MNRVLRFVIAIVALAIVAGGSFYGGMVYGKGQAQAARAVITGREGLPPGQFQQGQLPRPSGQGGMLVGQIEEIGEGKVLVTDSNGKQTWVYVTETTLIEKNASVTVADLARGDTVIVSGSPGNDGSITARSVQVSPGGRLAGATPGAPGTP